MKTKAVSEQKFSSLLTKEENETVVNMLGSRCQTLATTVIQLFSTDGPDGTDWLKRASGVLCLIRDSNRRSYFFRLFCLTRGQLIWEHEVYNSMEYTSPTTYLHTFEAEECLVAFNFANEAEAAYMEKVLHEKLKVKEEKRLERKARANNMQYTRNALKAAPCRPSPEPPPSTFNIMENGFPNMQTSTINSHLKRKTKRRTTGKITKADIGMPQEFRHVSHVGWNPYTGFDLDNVDDPKLQDFFARAGVSESHLQDRSTREFIYAFIEKHGGIDAVTEELDNRKPQISPAVQSAQPPAQQPPPVPQRVIQPLPNSSSSNNTSNNATTSVRPAPPPPSKTARGNVSLPPPPPPPITTIPTRSQDVLSRNALNSSIQPSNNTASPTIPPPPPPPPPPPIQPVEDKVEMSTSNNSVSTDPRSALMDAIRSGATLKHVDTESKKSDIGGDDSRDDLLNEIRKGVELKPVQQQPAKPQGAPFDGLAGALARALEERSRDIHGDESSASESSDDYDEEWEE